MANDTGDATWVCQTNPTIYADKSTKHPIAHFKGPRMTESRSTGMVLQSKAFLYIWTWEVIYVEIEHC